jgi:nitrate reductase molybdenum cofactor assembly chaperone NarJ/NarW
MDRSTASLLNLLAESFRYPAPGHLEVLERGQKSLAAGSEKEQIGLFLIQVRRLSLGAWEELHTRTLDLNPPAAPYIGFQTWGESYQRGEFLAKMNREIMECGIDADGELPDHLIPLLRYLAKADHPLAELGEVIDPAIQRMAAALRQADATNPYLHLLEAARNCARRGAYSGANSGAQSAGQSLLKEAE